MSDEQVRIERVTVLPGHTDPDSAYRVDDYPYGRLRCTIRYWIDTAEKGKAKGQQRFARQTTNPKRPGAPWNKPHYSTYVHLAVLHLDDKDHVQWWGTGLWMRPVQDARARLMGIVEQFTYDQGRTYEALLEASKHGDSRWGEFDETVTMLAAEIGSGYDPVPDITNGVWTVPTGSLIYLGDPIDVTTYLTLARQRAAQPNAGGV